MSSVDISSVNAELSSKDVGGVARGDATAPGVAPAAKTPVSWQWVTHIPWLDYEKEDPSVVVATESGAGVAWS